MAKKKPTIAQEKKAIMAELKTLGYKMPHGYTVTKRRKPSK